jgi:hypothetical protein
MCHRSSSRSPKLSNATPKVFPDFREFSLKLRNFLDWLLLDRQTVAG